jgi:6-phosphogluconolactonase/glucosamine-6-phosphate isomerase/deaminase
MQLTHNKEIPVDILPKNDKILLLLSGGSAIDFGVRLARVLASSNQLVIGQIDERYGPIGHPDSNWPKIDSLLPADYIKLPILTGQDVDQTTTRYITNINQLASDGYKIISVLGLGADSHTAGILPKSPATRSSELFSHYIGPDYSRITATNRLLTKAMITFVWAVDPSKKAAVDLLSSELSIYKYPSQVFKQLECCTIYI